LVATKVLGCHATGDFAREYKQAKGERSMEFIGLVGILTAYVSFRQWMQHDRRIMVHRERLAAIEKGIDLPPLEQEVQRSRWNVQRFLLWLGCLDIAFGIGVWLLLSVMMSFPPNKFTEDLPPGIQYVGVIPIGMGIAHLIAYFVEIRRERAIS
jgi:Domain of unknown function (DUF6249)